MVRVVAALILKDGKFMICQRPANKARGLKWEFAGGKREEGESDEEALTRECREELGVEIKVGKKFAETRHRYPDITVELAVYEAEIVLGEVKLLEHAAVKWITPFETQNYSFCAADAPIIKKLRKDAAGDVGKRKKKLGALGEKRAAAAYKKAGYKVVQKNYKTPFCEIDLILKKGDVTVFCEVKTRLSDTYGRPSEAVNEKKRALYVRAARVYLAGKPQTVLRFDVCEVFKEGVNIIENAFTA